MKTRRLGAIEVSEIGMGCMAFSHGYGRIPPEDYAVEAIRNAFDHGCTLFDTAEVYSPNLAGIGHNERIVGRALEPVRDRIVLATKLFVEPSEADAGGSVAGAVRRHLEASLSRLRTGRVDLYYLHRVGGVPVERVAEAMGALAAEGLIRGWGLSQVGTETLERAHRVFPVSAVQNLYSMVERDLEEQVAPWCLRNGVGIVPFSPIASGLLSGRITPETAFEKEDDVRNWVPQLSRANIAGNMPIVELLRETAAKKDATPAQISLAWMLHKYPNLVPIPGSKNKERIVENLGAAEVELTDAEFSDLEGALARLPVHGHRGLSH